jgi:hypothetical protein
MEETKNPGPGASEDTARENRVTADHSTADVMLQAALNCAEACGRVFPVVRRAKVPLVTNWRNLATKDEATIRKWWAQWPEANIGLTCGSGSNLFVLDVDPRHGGEATFQELKDRYGELPATAIVHTGGGGTHRYFTYPRGHHIGSSAGKLGPGVDIRGEGGFVVAPSSVHASGDCYRVPYGPSAPIADPPRWLIELLTAPQLALGSVGQSTANRIPAGQRNDALYRLARALKAKGLSPEALQAALLLENLAKCDPPLGEAEVRQLARHSVDQADRPYNRSGHEKRDAETTTSLRTDEWPSLDEAAYYGLAGDIVRTLDPHTEADPVALLVQTLSALGSVIGRQAHFVAEADRHYLNVYAVLVGETSKGRKGSSWGQIRRLFRSVDEDWAGTRVLAGLSSGEGLIWAVRDEITKQEPVRERGKPTGEYQEIVVDPGVADKRLLVLESEFGGTIRVMGRDGSTLSAVIRQAWDTGCLQTMTKNSPARATDAHISITGHITKDELIRLLDTTEAANGFANRFCWVAVRRSKSLPEGGRLGQDELTKLADRLRSVCTFGQAAQRLTRDDDARALWREIYTALSEGKPGLLGSVISRGEAQVMRHACLYAILDLSSVVRPVHLTAALAVWSYCEASARVIFGGRLGDPDADAILAALRTHHDGLTKTEIRDLFGRNRKEHQIDRALTVLLQQRLVSCTSEKTGGRPAERWRATRVTTKTI